MEKITTDISSFEKLRTGRYDYTGAYRGDLCSVSLIDVNFRTAKRNIDEPLFEPFRDAGNES